MQESRKLELKEEENSEAARLEDHGTRELNFRLYRAGQVKFQVNVVHAGTIWSNPQPPSSFSRIHTVQDNNNMHKNFNNTTESLLMFELFTLWYAYCYSGNAYYIQLSVSRRDENMTIKLMYLCLILAILLLLGLSIDLLIA